MIPDGWVGDRIITMMAMCMTWYQRYSAFNKEVWVLPPSFAVMVSISSLRIKYHENHHWYLMVIHIEERKIYHLDTHFLDSTITTRHAKIHCVVST
ncbi:hypothetical protein P8452_14966 [Trifolium repens]|nr:hypothetical protein P8452_14966 [Trifolium repens]